MAKQTTVMIHVDALRHDYVTPQEMPFLHALAQRGASGCVIPPFGFEPDGAYLTGRNPEDYEGGVHFVYSPETSPYRFARFLPGWIDRLGPHISFGFRRYVVERLVRFFAKTPRQKKQTFVGKIPFRELPRFDLCEQKYAFENGALNGLPTLYDLLRASKKKWFYHGAPAYPVGVDAVVTRVCNEIDGSYDFIFLFIADLDVVGHAHGPSSDERRRVARRVDAGIRSLYEHIQSQYETVNFLAFGDHGMVEVHRGIDVQGALRQLPLRPGRDYTVFLDSTFARFWFHKKIARGPIESMLAELPGGTLITKEDRDRYSIHWESRKFGDLIYWMDGGHVVHPDYWHFRKIKKGMHGYRDEVNDNHAAFVCCCRRAKGLGLIKGAVSMQDMFATTVSMLGMEKPYAALGRPVWEYDVKQ